MQQQPQVIYGPNGERAEWNGSEYIVASGPAPAAQSAGGYTIQPMTTPADARAARSEARQEENAAWTRQNQTEANRRSEEANARAARSEERAIRTAEIAARGGTPELRGKLALGIGPSVRAEDSLRVQEDGVNPLNRDWGAAALDSVPDFGLLSPIARVWGGQDYQNYNQSIKTLESSLLPIFSGMAVTPTEAQRFIRANQSQMGDTPETLKRKSANIQMILNEAAGLLDREIPYPEVGRYGDEGFRELLRTGDSAGIDPSLYITPPAAASSAGGGSGDGSGGSGGQPSNGPQPGDVQTTVSPLAPEDTPNSLSAQGYVYDAGSNTWKRSRQEQVDPAAARQEGEAQRSRPGIAGQMGVTDMGIGRRADAFMRGAADTLSFGLADEIAAGANTILPLDRGSRSGWQDGFGQAYQHNVNLQRGTDNADRKDLPVTRGAGQIGAGIVAAPRALAGAGAGLAANALRGAGVGAVYGGAYGFGSGEGNALDRAPSAAGGAAIGLAAGAAAPVAANAISRVAAPAVSGLQAGMRTLARPVVNALGGRAPAALREAVAPNPLARGLDAFAGNNRPNTAEMTARAAGLAEDVGRPVPLADAMNSGGRGVMRGAALRSDRAREMAGDFSSGRREALPQRMGQQARRIVSNDRRSPEAIQADLTTRRSNLARSDYAEPYAQQVEIGADVARNLTGAPGRSAIQRARAAAEAWQDDGVVAELDALGQAVQSGGPLPRVSAGAIDRIRQALSGRGEQLAQRPGTRAVGAGIQNRAGQVDQALENVQGLAPARAAYRDMSQQIEAVDAGGRFVGGNPDDILPVMAGASNDAQSAFRAAAARNIELRAGTTGSAPGVASRLAVPGTPQREIMDGTLGPIDAERLARAARGERDMVANANRADPGVGSNTNMDGVDTERARGVIAAIRRPISSAAEWVGERIAARGFSPQEAEAFIAAAQDPAQTDRLIGMLAERMSRREARNMARAIRYQLTIGPQSGQQR